jgi:hypothetical protein
MKVLSSLSFSPFSLICIVFAVMTEAVQWSDTSSAPLVCSSPFPPYFSVAEMDIAFAILASGAGWAGTKAVPSIASRSQQRKYLQTGSLGIWSVAMVSSLLTRYLSVCLSACRSTIWRFAVPPTIRSVSGPED